MSKIKTIVVVIAIIILYSFQADAQSIGLGGSVNHASGGLLLSYTTSRTDSKIKFEAGLRYMINHYSSTKINEQGYMYYKQGYAFNFPQRLGVSFNTSIRIIKVRFFELGFCGNALIAFNGLKRNSVTDTSSDVNVHKYFNDVEVSKGSPEIELTVGPIFTFYLSKKISMNGSFGYGIIYLNHSHIAHSDVTGGTIYIFEDSFMNKKRGAIDFVGVDKYPSINFSVKYNL